MIRFAIVCATVLQFAVTSRAGESYALLVAVGDYDVQQLDKLNYTRNDIVEFHGVLLKSGFKAENVVLMHDDPKNPPPLRLAPEASRIRKQLTLMLSGREPDDTLILAFAGHGVQFKGDRTSYFCPYDADLERKETLLPLTEVYEAMKACRARRKLLLVDACRNDPRTVVARSRKTVDLESITRPQKEPVPESVVAFFSCAAGQQSFEWPELKHGIFFYHVLDVWKRGVEGRKELTLDDLVHQTRLRTESFARKTLESVQTPELHGQSAGRWVLRTYPQRITVNSLGMKFARIPAGEFLRGSPESDGEGQSDERPQHRVRVQKDFHLGVHEVTKGQFRRFIEATGYRTDPETDGSGAYGYDLNRAAFLQKPEYTWRNSGFLQTDDHPVVNVSWNDAVAFCEWLSRQEKKSYRLPTEAEWEYACRGGTTTRYQTGDSSALLTKVANIADSAAKLKLPNLTTVTSSDGYVTTAPVGKFEPNTFGLCDMHGNVWEWCADWLDANEYQQFAQRAAVDPQGPRTGDYKISRGGGWHDAPFFVRTADRLGQLPRIGSGAQGFRIVEVLSDAD